MYKLWTDKEIKNIISQDTEKLQLDTLFDQLILILKDENNTRGETFQKICKLLPNAWKSPAQVQARIVFDGEVYESGIFQETEWKIDKSFGEDGKEGLIEIFHQKENHEIFTSEYQEKEKSFLEQIARLLEFYTANLKPKEKEASSKLEEIFSSNKAKLKELSIINQVALVLKESESLKSALQQIAFILPKITRYPSLTASRISYGNKSYESQMFRKTPWFISQTITTQNNTNIIFKVFFLKEFPDAEIGPFLRSEKNLLKSIIRTIKNYLESGEGEKIIDSYETTDHKTSKVTETKGKELLHNFLNKSNYDRNIHYDLMPFKVKEILIVANLYDAFSIEMEGRFSEYLIGQYHELNLTSLPRITGASDFEEAKHRMSKKHFDLVIVMMGANKKKPLEISQKIKEEFSYVPIYLLLNNNADAEAFKDQEKIPDYIDNIFAWNGDSRIFFAMIKLLEDKANAANDTRLNMSRIILIVEDSVSYYSRYLPLLYTSVMQQTRRIIDDVAQDELYKILHLRSRPKVMLATNFEEAMEIFEEYRNYLLCLITDVSFERNKERDKNAGFELVKTFRQKISNLPIAVQSAKIKNKEKTEEFDAVFINKNLQNLQHEIQHFIGFHLGFGNFHFRDSDGNSLAVARNINELEEKIRQIPKDSLLHHAKQNHFSLWLKARGEYEIAKLIAPYTINDFKSAEEVRHTLLSIIDQHRKEKQKGKVVEFSERAILEDTSIVKLGAGALGGKGRGVAFINTLLNFFDFSEYIPGIKLKMPRTAFIGTDEFINFIEQNGLHEIYTEKDYKKIKQIFYKSRLSEALLSKLRTYLGYIKKPLAIRSSGLFEDSLTQPFAGIFATYILPNNHEDFEVRLEQLIQAIKMVYASVFSKLAQEYIKAINYKIDDERMAIIIQELAGKQYGNYFYPHISGVAQSYNYYPYGHIKPEDGFAVTALGLGKYVVDGEKSYRFSPKYPNAKNFSAEELFKNSQTEFLALDMSQKVLNILEDDEDAGIVRLPISKAEKHGTLKHLASVYDFDNDRINEGLDSRGPRIVNFANILKHNFIPLAKTLDGVLDVIKEAFGTAVEIEFAVDLDKDRNGLATFHLLQIKPMVGGDVDTNIEIDDDTLKGAVLYSSHSLGNGQFFGIQDVIFVHPRYFDKMKTVEMSMEIEKLNYTMQQAGKKYVLIGPGRWGTNDKFLGIPVVWNQISNAKVIVELGQEDFKLDASLGSHFFHNITSMKIGYLSVDEGKNSEFVNWDVIENQEVIQETNYFTHVRFQNTLKIKLDGKKQRAIIKPGENEE